MNRRDFNKLSISAAIAPLLSSRASFAVAPVRPNRYSVMLWILDKSFSFERKLEMVAEAGFSNVEMTGEYAKWTPQEWKTNVAKLHALNMTVDSIAPGRNALADHTKRTALHDDLVKAMPMAKDLGCKQFIYTGYTRVPGQSPEDQRAAIVDSLKYAADILEKDGIELILETIDLLEYSQEAVPTMAEAFATVRAVNNPRVKVLYDFYHEQRQAGNLIEKLDGNIDLVGLVHVADVPGRHEPGTGEMNYTNIYKKLKELKYNRKICMEFRATGDPVKALIAAREEAERVLQT